MSAANLYMRLAKRIAKHPDMWPQLKDKGLNVADRILKATESAARADRFIEQLKPAHYELLAREMRPLVKEWLERIKAGDAHPDITPATARVKFVRCKYFGDDYPRYMSFAFTPEQLATPSGSGSILTVLENAVRPNDDKAVHGLIHVLGSNASLKGLMTAAQIPIGGSRGALDFPACTARDLIDEHCPTQGRILDPCHGWGGRFVGFLLADKPSEYVGVDPNPAAHRGLTKIREVLGRCAEDYKKSTFIAAPFEDAEVDGSFDFALTSPPYFDAEKYNGEHQSWRRYPNFERWCAGFYRVLIEKTFSLLKPGAKFCLIVGSQRYPLRERGIEFAEGAGFCVADCIPHIVKRNPLHQTSDDNGDTLLLFTKPAASLRPPAEIHNVVDLRAIAV